MFGLFKKRIPAPEHERALFVKRLFLMRLNDNPEAQMMAAMEGIDPTAIPPEALMQGAPEATLFRVVEQFLQMKDQGATDEFAVQTLNEMHSSLLATAGESLPILPAGATLYHYVRHNLDCLHGHGGGITDQFVVNAIQEVKSFYKR